MIDDDAEEAAAAPPAPRTAPFRGSATASPAVPVRLNVEDDDDDDDDDGWGIDSCWRIAR